MEWKTRVTELLGSRYPILQGAIAGLGNWQFAADIADTGAYGTITASVSRTPERLREDIRRCKEATSGVFGVNLSIGLSPEIEKMLEVCIEERVPVETSVYKPDALVPRIKESGITWMHKAARVKDAVHAAELGADAIIMVGLEGAGIKSPEQLPTMTTAIWGMKHIKVPFIISGGIADAHGFLGALGMGADGIMMATAFMATRECPMKDSAKQHLLTNRPDDPEVRKKVMMVEKEWKGRGESPSAGGEDRSAGSSYASFSSGALNGISTVKELIEHIVTEAETILDSWQFLKGR